MCYTGKCPYEYGWTYNGSMGECRLKYGEPVPDDAYCVVTERWIEEQRRKHPIKTLVNDFKLNFDLLRWKLSRQSEVPF